MSSSRCVVALEDPAPVVGDPSVREVGVHVARDELLPGRAHRRGAAPRGYGAAAGGGASHAGASARTASGDESVVHEDVLLDPQAPVTPLEVARTVFPYSSRRSDPRARRSADRSPARIPASPPHASSVNQREEAPYRERQSDAGGCRWSRRLLLEQFGELPPLERLPTSPASRPSQASSHGSGS